MSENNNKKRDWVDVGVKLLTPVIVGLLIAWAGYVSNYTLSSISSRQESARLITELQIRREQAESALRKDVFDQTLQAFLLKKQETDSSIRGLSKQLLRLELLALNFGDSLSLSPLFTEFRRDLFLLEPGEEDDLSAFEDDKGELRKRLYSLARRVANNQVASLSQHGVSKLIRIPVPAYNAEVAKDCSLVLYEAQFPWPERIIQQSIGIYDDKNNLLLSDEVIKEMFKSDENRSVYIESLNEARGMELQRKPRYLDVKISDIDHCEKSAKITISIYKDGKVDLQDKENQPEEIPVDGLGDLSALSSQHGNYILETERSFKLDYFNFPIVDNTRLENNHRFAIVLDEFDLESKDPYIELIGIIFPSEYASLRDRPGMKEARNLLKSALNDEEDEEDKEKK
ncbi:MAG: hypothetical protein DRQ44_07705 [Gammaproteobacteria bacterium]|nr:MAG: hypothetical protein DRQ44_07705 [Gammaproteobacteria bacterium]